MHARRGDTATSPRAGRAESQHADRVPLGRLREKHSRSRAASASRTVRAASTTVVHGMASPRIQVDDNSIWAARYRPTANSRCVFSSTPICTSRHDGRDVFSAIRYSPSLSSPGCCILQRRWRPHLRVLHEEAVAGDAFGAAHQRQRSPGDMRHHPFGNGVAGTSRDHHS